MRLSQRTRPAIAGLAMSAAALLLATESTPAASSTSAPRAQEWRLPAERILPQPRHIPMQVTFYARRDGAAVRSGPHVTKPVVQTLNENEPVSVVGKLLFNDDEVKERVWYELRLAGGGTGFSSEDELLSDRALKEKNRYRQWVTQLDETLYRLRGEGTGPHHQRSGVWIPGNNCLDFHEVALVDHRSVPRPNQVNANLNDPAIAIFFSLVHFVVVEDTTIHVATAEEPAKFRFGRLERIKDVNGKAAYRARMADGGEGFVLSFDGPRFAMAHDVVPSKGPVTPSQVCTDAEADDIQKKLERALLRRIALIAAE